MKKSGSPRITVTEQVIETMIYELRGSRVMIDHDLASLYGVETKRLKEQVKRNPDRFPSDFMFELNDLEYANLRSQIATSSLHGGNRYKPLAFTEHGVLILSSVLNSEQAIQVNIHIMRVYSKMKELLISHRDILIKLEQIQKKVGKNETDVAMIFACLKELIGTPKTDRPRIGYKK